MYTLKPARAKSWTVASCSEPLGMPSLSFIIKALRSLVGQLSEEARSLARMAHVAVALPDDLHQHRVVVAIDEDVDDLEPVARCFALHPQRVARAAEEGGEAGASRQRERLFIHETDHQDLGGLRVLNHGRNQAS